MSVSGGTLNKAGTMQIKSMASSCRLWNRSAWVGSREPGHHGLQWNKGCGVDHVVLICTLCPALSHLQKKRLSWSRLCWRTCCRPRWGVTTATRAPWPRRPAAKWWSGSSSADLSTSHTNRWETHTQWEIEWLRFKINYPGPRTSYYQDMFYYIRM